MNTMNINDLMAYAVMVHDAIGYVSSQKNRNLLMSYIKEIDTAPNRLDFTHQDVPDEEQRERGDEICDFYTRKLTFGMFKETNNSFEQELYNALVSKEVPLNPKMIGIIVAMPKTYYRDKSILDWKDEARKLAETSEWIGEPGQSYNKTLVIRRRSYITKSAITIIEGVDENNNLFVSFSNWHDSRITPNATIKAFIYIRRHQINRYHGGKETVMTVNVF